jgi:hypothetical protein
VSLEYWKDQLNNHDLLTFHIDPDLRKLWIPILGKKVMRDFFPLHAVYALVSTRSIFHSLKSMKVGIIGPAEKLSLIKKLMRNRQYTEYLQFEGFKAYVEVPQTGACNDVEGVVRSTAGQIKRDPCDVYLYGMGIAKIVVVPKVKEGTNRVFVDIGCGLDAIAGIVPKDREYFGHWKNHKIAGYDLSDIDVLTPKRSPRQMKRFFTYPDVIF